MAILPEAQPVSSLRTSAALASLAKAKEQIDRALRLGDALTAMERNALGLALSSVAAVVLAHQDEASALVAPARVEGDVPI